MRRRRFWVVGMAGVAALAAAFAGTGSAGAATALPDKTVVNSSTPGDYTYTISTTNWSVVAEHPETGDYDMSLYTSGGTGLDFSGWGTGMTDFIAVNSHSGKQPLGSYRASVRLFSGGGPYAIQLRKNATTLTLPIPAWDGVGGLGDPDITFAVLPDTEVVALYQVHLDAGQKFWVSSTNAIGKLFLLESTSDPASWVQNRAEADSGNATVVDGCTLYSANVSNWHALVLIGDRSPTSSSGGIGYALHRYDPARPAKCPIKNFPDRTDPV
jgi:hypothetical protein